MQPGRYGLVVSGLIRVDSDGVGGDGGLLVVVLVGPVHLLLVPVRSAGLGLPFPSRSSPGNWSASSRCRHRSRRLLHMPTNPSPWS